jgi:predicted nucleic acid-binding Zn ribbon protein
MTQSIRMCPVCNDITQIGYGKKTCSSECGRAWVKMSKSEQRARLEWSLLSPAERIDRLKDEVSTNTDSDKPESSILDEPSIGKSGDFPESLKKLLTTSSDEKEGKEE